IINASVAAVDPLTEQPRTLKFLLARDGQRLNVDVVFLGRGNLTGQVVAADGRTPVANAIVRATSLIDHSSWGATTDQAGKFAILNVPVGNVVLEAVSVETQTSALISESIPFAGATVTTR